MAAVRQGHSYLASRRHVWRAASRASSSRKVASRGEHAANYLTLGDPQLTHPYDFFLRKDEPDEADEELCLVADTTATAGGCWGSPSEVRRRLWADDPSLNQGLISSGTTISQLFSPDHWDTHRRASRYFTHLLRMPNSTVFRRVLPPCAALTAIAALVCAFNACSPASWAKLAVSALPHTLVGAAISLQLVFRTNGSYARFVEGRALWGRLVQGSRDWARLVAVYLPFALSTRAAAYIQALAFCLKAFVRRPPKDAPTGPCDAEVVVRQLLPEDEAEEVLGQKNRCYFLICKMTELLREGRKSLPQAAALQLEDTLGALLGVIGGCERMVGTPIPLSYTRHTSRCLVLWLATLPMALWPVMQWAAVPAMFLLCFIFLGIDEIGVEVEEPFCILPLLPLCKVIMRDVCTAMEFADPRRPAYAA